MVRRTLIALALIGLGWTVAWAQAQAPDFELSVVTKDGTTTVECLRGCCLQWVEWVVPDRAGAKKAVSFGSCNGRPDGCPSGRIGGWITK